MTALGIFLLVNAAFNIVVWPQFLRRVAKDPRARDDAGKVTAFFTVHLVLITIALVLAVVSAVFGIVVLTGGL